MKFCLQVVHKRNWHIIIGLYWVSSTTTPTNLAVTQYIWYSHLQHIVLFKISLVQPFPRDFKCFSCYKWILFLPPHCLDSTHLRINLFFLVRIGPKINKIQFSLAVVSKSCCFMK